MSKLHNDGVHVVYILNKTECARHGASEGEPCWGVYQSDTGRYLPALCGSRVKKAGFRGTVSALSLNKKTPRGSAGGVIKRVEASRANNFR